MLMEREKSIATINNDISFISNPGEINVTAESESLFFTHVCFSCCFFQIEKYFSMYLNQGRLIPHLYACVLVCFF